MHRVSVCVPVVVRVMVMVGVPVPLVALLVIAVVVAFVDVVAAAWMKERMAIDTKKRENGREKKRKRETK